MNRENSFVSSGVSLSKVSSPSCNRVKSSSKRLCLWSERNSIQKNLGKSDENIFCTKFVFVFVLFQNFLHLFCLFRGNFLAFQVFYNILLVKLFCTAQIMGLLECIRVLIAEYIPGNILDCNRTICIVGTGKVSLFCIWSKYKVRFNNLILAARSFDWLLFRLFSESFIFNYRIHTQQIIFKSTCKYSFSRNFWIRNEAKRH